MKINKIPVLRCVDRFKEIILRVNNNNSYIITNYSDEIAAIISIDDLRLLKNIKRQTNATKTGI
jgi:prevent-host-death family protein